MCGSVHCPLFVWLNRYLFCQRIAFFFVNCLTLSFVRILCFCEIRFIIIGSEYICGISGFQKDAAGMGTAIYQQRRGADSLFNGCSEAGASCAAV